VRIFFSACIRRMLPTFWWS